VSYACFHRNHGINQRKKVWLSGNGVRIIDCVIDLLVKARAEAGRDVTACREPHVSNVVLLKVPLLCVLAREPNGALRILERNVGSLRISPDRKTVGQAKIP